MASIQATPAMQAGPPALPPNLTNQQVQEVYQVRLRQLSIHRPRPSSFLILPLASPTNRNPEIPADESIESP